MVTMERLVELYRQTQQIAVGAEYLPQGVQRRLVEDMEILAELIARRKGEEKA